MHRLAGDQVLQLGALENETRGGVARVKLGAVQPGATGFALEATQILDSTFLTFGIVSALDATDTAMASAGLSSVDPSSPHFLRMGLGQQRVRQHLQHGDSESVQ